MEGIPDQNIVEEGPTIQEKETIKKELFKMAMKGQWDRVVGVYKDKAWAHEIKITKSGDTALHIAIADCKEEKVKDLIQQISTQPRCKAALKIKNERGNTPLHIAASIGNVAMCQCIARVDPLLVGARNGNWETPFFLAALHGRKEAFLSLHQFCGTQNGYEHSRREDGDTILHCTIARDYFDLAFQIIHLYENLVNYVNKEGISPLHLLASKPSAFKSGSHLGGLYQIIYHCILVDELKLETSHHQTTGTNSLDDKKDLNCPVDYRTCINFFQLFRDMAQVVTCKRWNGEQTDAENPEGPNAGHQTASLCDTIKSIITCKRRNGEQTDAKEFEAPKAGHPGHQSVAANDGTFFHEFAKLASKAMLLVLGLGFKATTRKIQEKKQKHIWAVQIMNELLNRTSTYEDAGTEPKPETSKEEDDTKPYGIAEGGNVTFESVTTDYVGTTGINGKEKTPERAKTNLVIDSKNCVNDIVEKILALFRVAIHDMNPEKKNILMLAGKDKPPEIAKETPILIAAKNGVTEIVDGILERFPVAIHDMNADKKNIVLLAVENRQPLLYQLLLRKNIQKDSVFQQVDNEGNSAQHLAAKLGDYKPWLIPGAALQMQWEIKWYEFVKDSMPLHFFPGYNNQGKTPRDLFTETHEDLVINGGKWLSNTSQSCSVVAALIATVAFATSANVPGGFGKRGTPTLGNKPGFNLFAISSLCALCSSITALVTFLAILTSRYEERDFGKGLPWKLLMGLTSLFFSIASMLISFCAGHLFVLNDELRYAAFPVYALTCLPVTYFAVAQFPLYFDLLWATFKNVPQRSYKVVLL